MADLPRLLIEEWLPVKELGIESRRERAAASALPPLSFLHVWWARRPLVASAGAVLGSVMPAWSQELADAFPGARELSSQASYQAWFLQLCGILGDPIEADARMAFARDSGHRIPNPYTYKQAFKNSPSTLDLGLLHAVLLRTWGDMPCLIDPTAGGGSIPYEAIRYGLPVTANDLNSVAASVLKAGLQIPSRFQGSVLSDLERYGRRLVRAVERRLLPFFPDGPGETVATFLFARCVTCPRTGKQVPLSPNWWLSREAGGVAARLVTERGGVELDAPEFEVVSGRDIDFDPDQGTVARGTSVSPWDGLAIDGDYIKSEAQAGRMGSVLYAVAVRVNGKRSFRAPTPTDLAAISAAEGELERLKARWEEEDVLPSEAVPEGNDTRPHQYGMSRWRDMFSPRQQLVHGTFVEEYHRLVPELRAEVEDAERADAILALLAMMQSKALNYNSFLASWHVPRAVMRSVFDRHDFAFKWTFAEFEGARELFQWTLSQVLDAYQGISKLLDPSDRESEFAVSLDYPVPGPVTVLRGTAGNLPSVSDGSQVAVCIDPPYYDNVMYAELSDFFYAWEKRTLGRIWPEFFEDELTDKKNEAVANPARFKSAGRRRNELATADYEAKMTAIFSEAHRVLRDDGVLTVMFTHKRAEAWNTLGISLMDAGFTIETSWPVPTESDTSLHQAKKNAASSTIFLVCRKRAGSGGESVFFEDIEGEVRAAAREALERFTGFGIDGVDLLLSTYGPALSVISSHWPVYSSDVDEAGGNRLLRPEEALATAREELVRLQRERLIGRATQLDDLTDFTLLAWQVFQAREFPFDEARRLALAVGGMSVETLARAKIVSQKAGTVVLLEPAKRVRRRGEGDAALPGVRLDAASFPHMIDAAHTAMHITSQDGPAAARDWLERLGLTRDARFLATVQGLINAVPRTQRKGTWVVPEAGWLDELAVFLDGITVPAREQPQFEQASLGFMDASEDDPDGGDEGQADEDDAG